MAIKLNTQNITNMYTPIELVSTNIGQIAYYGGGGGVTDHGYLHGLGDNDHPQYLLSSRSTQFIPATNSTLYQLVANSSLSLGTGAAQSFIYVSNSSYLIAESNSSLFALSNHIHTGYLSDPAASDHSHGPVETVSVAGSDMNFISASSGLTVEVPNYLTTAYGVAIKGSGTYTQNIGTIEFSNTNGLTFGLETNGVMTAQMEYPDQVGILGIWDGVSSLQTNSSLQFANSNGLSFGLNGSTMTGSYTVPGNTVFSNSNNVEFGLDGSTVTALALFSQSVQTQNIMGVSVFLDNTASEGTFVEINSGTLYLGAMNHIFLYQDGNSIGIYDSFTDGGTHNVSLAGNTIGTLTDISSGTMVIAGGNNITLSQADNFITIIGADQGGVQTFIGGIAASNTTYTSGTVIWSAANTNLTIGSYASSDSQYIRLSIGNYLTTAAASNHTHGLSISTASTVGSDIKFTSASNGLTVGIPAYLTTAIPVISTSVFAKTGFTTVSTSGSDVQGTLNTNGFNLAIPKYLTTSPSITNTYAGTGFSSTSITGTDIKGTLNTNGLNLGIPVYNTSVGSHAHTQYAGISSTGISGGGSATINSSQVLLNVPIGSLYFQDYNNVSWGGSTNGSTTTITATVTFAGGTGGGGAALQGSGSYTQNSGTIQFSNGGGLSFGLTNNVMTASHNALISTSQFSSVLTTLMPMSMSSQFQTGTLANTFVNTARSTEWGTSYLIAHGLMGSDYSTHTHGSVSLSLVNLSGSASSLRNGLTLSLTGVAGGSGNLAVQATGTYILTSGTVFFAQSNGISFGLNTNNVITGSHNAFVSSSQLTNYFLPLANSTQWASSILDDTFLTTAAQVSHTHGSNVSLALQYLAGNAASNSAGLTLSLTGSVAGGGGGAAIGDSGTYTQNSGTIIFQTSPYITFGLSNNGSLTASHNAYTAPSQVAAAVSLSTLMPLSYSSGFQTATLSNTFMPLTYSTGFRTATLATALLPLANSTQWATNVLSTRFLITAANSTHTHGAANLYTTNISGTISSVSSGLSLSLNYPASSNFVNRTETGSVVFQNIAGFSFTSSVNGSTTYIGLSTN